MTTLARLAGRARLNRSPALAVLCLVLAMAWIGWSGGQTARKIVLEQQRDMKFAWSGKFERR